MKHGRGFERLSPIAVGLLITAAGLGCTGSVMHSGGRPWDVITLDAKGQTLKVAVACDDDSRKLGLMYRKELPENEGMIFIFPVSRQQSFWMKNCHFDLSIGFLGDDGKILEIENMKAEDESNTQSKNQVRYALEVNKGWFQRHGIAEGDTFSDFRTKIGRFKER